MKLDFRQDALRRVIGTACLIRRFIIQVGIILAQLSLSKPVIIVFKYCLKFHHVLVMKNLTTDAFDTHHVILTPRKTTYIIHQRNYCAEDVA